MMIHGAPGFKEWENSKVNVRADAAAAVNCPPSTGADGRDRLACNDIIT
jgi:hypothetical protein